MNFERRELFRSHVDSISKSVRRLREILQITSRDTSFVSNDDMLSTASMLQAENLELEKVNEIIMYNNQLAVHLQSQYQEVTGAMPTVGCPSGTLSGVPHGFSAVGCQTESDLSRLPSPPRSLQATGNAAIQQPLTAPISLNESPSGNIRHTANRVVLGSSSISVESTRSPALTGDLTPAEEVHVRLEVGEPTMGPDQSPLSSWQPNLEVAYSGKQLSPSLAMPPPGKRAAQQQLQGSLSKRKSASTTFSPAHSLIPNSDASRIPRTAKAEAADKIITALHPPAIPTGDKLPYNLKTHDGRRRTRTEWTTSKTMANQANTVHEDIVERSPPTEDASGGESNTFIPPQQ